MSDFSKIEELYHDALELPADERSAFIERECGGNEEMRREVELLLGFDADAAEFIERPPGDVAATLFTNQTARDLIGETLDHYRVIAPLGHGGMGEVYLAEDTKLGRKTAIKLLPALFSADPERKKRFEKEARTVSALNHPNIITVYGIEHALNLDFIATEFIDGRTLRELISDGPMPWPEAVEIAMQMTAALESAHAVGVIHRDIKPANVMRRTDGIVKVLDFGLAKLTMAGGDSGSFDTQSQTAPNRVMGTISYMSPEQALGQRIDLRTDVFSTGIVIYEMLTGRQPFSGASDAAVYNATLNLDPPSMSSFSSTIPAPLEKIVARALAKKPADRYQTIGELRQDLNFLRQSASGRVSGRSLDGYSFGRAPVSRRLPWRRLTAAAALIAIACVLGLYFRGSHSSAAGPDLRSFSFTKTTSQSGKELFPSLSPDAKTVIYEARGAGNSDIFALRIGGKNPLNLTSDSKADDSQPVFSPDGERIAFRSERDGGGIFVMGATGESPRRISDFGFNPSWSPDGKEVAVSIEGISDWSARANDVSQLWAIDVTTGAKRFVSDFDTVQPAWSPNGKFIAFWTTDEKGQRDVGIAPAAGGKAALLTNDSPVDWNPVWSPDGQYLYFASNRGGNMNLWRLAIDSNSGAARGEPEPATIPSSNGQHFCFSRDGKRFAYVQDDSRNTIKRIGFDPKTAKPKGAPSFLISDTQIAIHPSVSPDGEWIAFSSAGSIQEDIFIIRKDGSGLRHLTDDPGLDRLPRWSPDGKRIYSYSDRGGKYEIWNVKPDGSELSAITDVPGVTIRYPVFSPDGTKLAFVQGDEGTRIMDANLAFKDQTVEIVPRIDDKTVFEPWSWSPDGKFLTGSARTQDGYWRGIYGYRPSDRTFHRLSERGILPIWMKDSRRLLFTEKDELFVIDVQTGKSEFVHRDESGSVLHFDIAPDEQTIYYGTSLAEADIWFGVAP